MPNVERGMPVARSWAAESTVLVMLPLDLSLLQPGLLVLVKGAGDLASGVAWRLHRSGFAVVMTEIARPTAIRRAVAFAEAIYDGEATVEGVTARRAFLRQVPGTLRQGFIPILVDPEARAVGALRPQVVVDAIMAKGNLGTTLDDAPLVIALGPGFVAGRDAHAVIETQRGHRLGRVLRAGLAEPNTGIPGGVNGHGSDRVLRSPAAGVFRGLKTIGEDVTPGEVAATVDGVPVPATISGVVRGILRDGLLVQPGMKVGDIDPRGVREHCFTVSDKALAVAGGVLEAILSAGLPAVSAQVSA
jgi:xanthine dehydrogenase accessory factor